MKVSAEVEIACSLALRQAVAWFPDPDDAAHPAALGSGSVAVEEALKRCVVPHWRRYPS